MMYVYIPPSAGRYIASVQGTYVMIHGPTKCHEGEASAPNRLPLWEASPHVTTLEEGESPDLLVAVHRIRCHCGKFDYDRGRAMRGAIKGDD